MRTVPIRRERGFSFIELMVVLLMIATLVGVALPYFRNVSSKTAAREAGDAIAALQASARMSAIQRGRSTALRIPASTNKAYVTAVKVTSSGIDTVGKVVDLNEQYGVTVSSTSDSIGFSPRGIGNLGSTVTIVITKGAFAESLTIAVGGRLKRS